MFTFIYEDKNLIKMMKIKLDYLIVKLEFYSYFDKKPFISLKSEFETS